MTLIIFLPLIFWVWQKNEGQKNGLAIILSRTILRKNDRSDVYRT